MQHHLPACNRYRLTGFVFLFHDIKKGAHKVFTGAAPLHWNLGFVEGADISDAGSSWNLAGSEVLYKKTFFGI